MNRQTPKAVKALHEKLSGHALVKKITVIDVGEYDFPVMYERRGRHPHPPDRLDECGEIIASADGIVVASPEYNGSFSGALKNAMDYFYKEYFKKPMAVMTVSTGKRGGINASHDLQKYILALRGYPLWFKLLVPRIRKSIDENGRIQDASLENAFERFASELMWFTDAIAQKQQRS